MPKPVAAVAITATLLAGSAVGAWVVGGPIRSGADPALQAVQAEPDPAPPTPPATRWRERIASALGPLVADGTLTQAQADAVLDALEAARPPGRGIFPGRGGAGLDEVAGVLGMERVDLVAELRGGKTIAAIAGERGVDVQVVIDALVAAESAHLDRLVTAGRLSAEEVANLKEFLPARAAAVVNGEVPIRGRHRHPSPPG